MCPSVALNNLHSLVAKHCTPSVLGVPDWNNIIPEQTANNLCQLERDVY